MSMNDTLNETFNLEPVEVVKGDVITKTGEVIVPQHDTNNEKVEYDYETTRGNLHSLLAQGQDALLHALEIAKSSEHPRAFEVVGGLMKQLSDINSQLLDLSEKRQKLIDKTKPAEQNNPQVTNNNAIFVGSTHELNKMLRDMNKGV